jgi:hypothetical protein
MSAQLEQYARAAELFEQLAKASIDSNLLKWGAKDHFLKAGLCHMCTADMIATERAIADYQALFPSFSDQRECKLLKDLKEAIDEQNLERVRAAPAAGGASARPACARLRRAKRAARLAAVYNRRAGVRRGDATRPVDDVRPAEDQEIHRAGGWRCPLELRTEKASPRLVSSPRKSDRLLCARAPRRIFS